MRYVNRKHNERFYRYITYYVIKLPVLYTIGLRNRFHNLNNLNLITYTKYVGIYLSIIRVIKTNTIVHIIVDCCYESEEGFHRINIYLLYLLYCSKLYRF